MTKNRTIQKQISKQFSESIQDLNAVISVTNVETILNEDGTLDASLIARVNLSNPIDAHEYYRLVQRINAQEKPTPLRQKAGRQSPDVNKNERMVVRLVATINPDGVTVFSLTDK